FNQDANKAEKQGAPLGANSENQNQQINNSSGEAPPPYAGLPPANITFDTTKMTKAKIKDAYKDRVQIETLDLANQWIEIGDNCNCEYTIDSLVMRNVLLEAKHFHIPQATIGTFIMDHSSIKAHSLHKARISIGSLIIGNGCIDFGNMH
ncbi:hypothetical protein PMAYCL1PPCAC_31770, partial [Pristionchus mayeri]